MLTEAAARSCPTGPAVRSVAALVRGGMTYDALDSQVRARRWQRVGRAIVLHNGELDRGQLREVALVNAGPRAALTSFTALELRGFAGWEREAVHVLVPAGARVTRCAGVPVRLHWTARWSSRSTGGGHLHDTADSALLAAASFDRPRSACGLVAAVVQQRLARPETLAAALRRSTRHRHRAVLLAAVRDIGQGVDALSEIDLARLCRRAGLPEPRRQAVRVEPSGRRRYLDAEWRDSRGGRVVVEVDGALHLVATRWWDDQLRQNELTITGDRVLRFPSVVLRCEEAVVVDQLRRALR